MTNRNPEKPGAGSHRGLRVLGGLLALALVAGGLLAWYIAARDTAGISPVRGSVMSVDRAAGSFTVAPTLAQGRVTGCKRISRAGYPTINCPPGLPPLKDLTIEVTASTRFDRCRTNRCSAGGRAALRLGQRVLVVGPTSSGAIRATHISLLNPA